MPFLGIGGRRPNEPEVNKRQEREIRFWKSELDNSVNEKKQWLEKYAAAARQNEILRAEIFLLQQDSYAVRLQLEMLKGMGTGHENRPVLSAPGPTPQAAALPASAPAIEEEVFTTASARFQAATPSAPAASMSPWHGQHASQLQDALSRAQQEASNLKRQLREMQARNTSLEQELEKQRTQGSFLKATADAYQNEANLLRGKLLTQHGINDETADETVKVLTELARAQQTNALLKRDNALKDGIIQMLKQELEDVVGRASHTPRISQSSTGGACSPTHPHTRCLPSGTETPLRQELFDMLSQPSKWGQQYDSSSFSSGVQRYEPPYVPSEDGLSSKGWREGLSVVEDLVGAVSREPDPERQAAATVTAVEALALTMALASEPLNAASEVEIEQARQVASVANDGPGPASMRSNGLYDEAVESESEHVGPWADAIVGNAVPGTPAVGSACTASMVDGGTAGSTVALHDNMAFEAHPAVMAEAGFLPATTHAAPCPALAAEPGFRAMEVPSTTTPEAAYAESASLSLAPVAAMAVAPAVPCPGAAGEAGAIDSAVPSTTVVESTSERPAEVAAAAAAVEDEVAVTAAPDAEAAGEFHTTAAASGSPADEAAFGAGSGKAAAESVTAAAFQGAAADITSAAVSQGAVTNSTSVSLPTAEPAPVTAAAVSQGAVVNSTSASLLTAEPVTVTAAAAFQGAVTSSTSASQLAVEPLTVTVAAVSQNDVTNSTSASLLAAEPVSVTAAAVSQGAVTNSTSASQLAAEPVTVTAASAFRGAAANKESKEQAVAGRSQFAAAKAMWQQQVSPRKHTADPASIQSFSGSSSRFSSRSSSMRGAAATIAAAEAAVAGHADKPAAQEPTSVEQDADLDQKVTTPRGDVHTEADVQAAAVQLDAVAYIRPGQEREAGSPPGFSTVYTNAFFSSQATAALLEGPAVASALPNPIQPTASANPAAADSSAQVSAAVRPLAAAMSTAAVVEASPSPPWASALRRSSLGSKPKVEPKAVASQPDTAEPPPAVAASTQPSLPAVPPAGNMGDTDVSMPRQPSDRRTGGTAARGTVAQGQAAASQGLSEHRAASGSSQDVPATPAASSARAGATSVNIKEAAAAAAVINEAAAAATAAKDEAVAAAAATAAKNEAAAAATAAKNEAAVAAQTDADAPPPPPWAALRRSSLGSKPPGLQVPLAAASRPQTPTSAPPSSPFNPAAAALVGTADAAVSRGPSGLARSGSGSGASNGTAGASTAGDGQHAVRAPAVNPQALHAQLAASQASASGRPNEAVATATGSEAPPPPWAALRRPSLGSKPAESASFPRRQTTDNVADAPAPQVPSLARRQSMDAIEAQAQLLHRRQSLDSRPADKPRQLSGAGSVSAGPSSGASTPKYQQQRDVFGNGASGGVLDGETQVHVRLNDRSDGKFSSDARKLPAAAGGAAKAAGLPPPGPGSVGSRVASFEGANAPPSNASRISQMRQMFEAGRK